MQVTVSSEAGEALDGVLKYTVAEYSFRFTPGSPQELAHRVGDGGQTSLSVGTLQIEVGIETGILLFAWGLHPKERWSVGRLETPQAEPGIVKVSGCKALAAGVSIGVAAVGDWSTTYDPETGWVRTTEDERPDEEHVLIATDLVVGLRQGALSSVWLQPIFD